MSDDVNRLRAPCSLMVDKITTVARSELGEPIGTLGDEELVQLDRSILVFLGLAG